MAKEKVLITVKTYPTISEKYKELACTAGFREDGSWIRLYPIPFRLLDQERRNWFEQKAEPPDDGGYLLSEQACAVTVDLQCAFCAGAWIAVVVLAAAAIDAHLHDAEGFTGNAKRAIDEAGADLQLHTLRKRRNALIHSDPDSRDHRRSTMVRTCETRRRCPACGRIGLSRVLCQPFSLNVGKICNVKCAPSEGWHERWVQATGVRVQAP